MKTLVIVSHPEVDNSTSQQFLLSSIPESAEVTVHHIERAYPTGEIDRQAELNLLTSHQRIIFQFPLYWYSSPGFFKVWQDVVFSGSDLYTASGTILSGKELGLVLVIGVKEGAYRAGGKEGVTVDELTKPYQAFARHFGMEYLPSLNIHQFAYLNEEKKYQLLLDYQYYLSGSREQSLLCRSQWLLEQLQTTALDALPQSEHQRLDFVIERVAENTESLQELNQTLANF